MITSCTCTALYLLQRTFTASSLVSFFYTSGQPDDHINPPGSNTILKLVNIISLVLISSLNFKLIYHLLYISTWMSPKHITELYFFFSPRIYPSPTTNHWCTSQIIGQHVPHSQFYNLSYANTINSNSKTYVELIHLSPYCGSYLNLTIRTFNPSSLLLLFLFTQIAEFM